MITIDSLLPTQVPPAPSGSLTVTVHCGGSPFYRRQGTHAATIDSDWSFRSHHDLEAESLATSLGSTCACVQIASDVLPVASDWLRYQLRLGVAPLTWLGDYWSARPLVTMDCTAHMLPDPLDAAQHVRSVTHLASRHRVSFLHLQDLVEQISAAYRMGPSIGDDPHDRALARRAVPSIADLDFLWEFGISARTVRDMHLIAAAPWQGPLPRDFYTPATAKAVGLEWVEQTLRRTVRSTWPNDELIVDLARSMTEADGNDPNERATWLNMFVNSDAAAILSDAGYRPSDAAILAEHRHPSVPAASDALLAWTIHGFRPTSSFLASNAATAGTPLPPNSYRMQMLLRDVPRRRHHRLSAADSAVTASSKAEANAYVLTPDERAVADEVIEVLADFQIPGIAVDFAPLGRERAIRIHWTDGPSILALRALFGVSKHEYFLRRMSWPVVTAGMLAALVAGDLSVDPLGGFRGAEASHWSVIEQAATRVNAGRWGSPQLSQLAARLLPPGSESTDEAGLAQVVFRHSCRAQAAWPRNTAGVRQPIDPEFHKADLPVGRRLLEEVVGLPRPLAALDPAPTPATPLPADVPLPVILRHVAALHRSTLLRAWELSEEPLRSPLPPFVARLQPQWPVAPEHLETAIDDVLRWGQGGVADWLDEEPVVRLRCGDGVHTLSLRDRRWRALEHEGWSEHAEAIAAALAGSDIPACLSAITDGATMQKSTNPLMPRLLTFAARETSRWATPCHRRSSHAAAHV